MGGGYHSLDSSPPPAAGGGVQMQVAGAAAEGGNKWEGVAVVGAATLARNLSSASQRFRAVERSRSTSGHRGGAGLQAAVRRAFSMRRPPPSFAEGYWRIHDDMDGDGDGGTAEQQGKHAFGEEEEEQKKKGSLEQADVGAAPLNKEEIGTATKKKKRGHILKACKKLLGF